MIAIMVMSTWDGLDGVLGLLTRAMFCHKHRLMRMEFGRILELLQTVWLGSSSDHLLTLNQAESLMEGSDMPA